ncbi:MAG: hypothetical protein AAB276_08935 [Pseudomonadota bacterium]
MHAKHSLTTHIPSPMKAIFHHVVAGAAETGTKIGPFGILINVGAIDIGIAASATSPVAAATVNSIGAASTIGLAVMGCGAIAAVTAAGAGVFKMGEKTKAYANDVSIETAHRLNLMGQFLAAVGPVALVSALYVSTSPSHENCKIPAMTSAADHKCTLNQQ